MAVTLIECDDSIRDARLVHQRGQSELAIDDTRGWSHYLHSEAMEAGILDTSDKPLEAGVAHIARYLES